MQAETAPSASGAVVHRVTINIPPGYHQYKFMVDNEWCHDESQPYMPSLPHTNVPVADLDAAVEYIGRRQMRRLHDGECGVQPVRAGSAAPDL